MMKIQFAKIIVGTLYTVLLNECMHVCDQFSQFQMYCVANVCSSHFRPYRVDNRHQPFGHFLISHVSSEILYGEKLVNRSKKETQHSFQLENKSLYRFVIFRSCLDKCLNWLRFTMICPRFQKLHF